MHSLSKGKFTIPKVWNAKKAMISGNKLRENKKAIDELYLKIKSRTIASQAV